MPPRKQRLLPVTSVRLKPKNAAGDNASQVGSDADSVASQEAEALPTLDDQQKRALNIQLNAALENRNYEAAKNLINQGAEIDQGDLELEQELDALLAQDAVGGNPAAPPVDEDMAEEDAVAMVDGEYANQFIAERVILQMIADRRAYLEGFAAADDAQKQALKKPVDDGYRFLEFLAEKDQISDRLTVLETAADYAQQGDSKFLLDLLNIKGVEKFGWNKINQAWQIVQDQLPKQGDAVDRAGTAFQSGVEQAASSHSVLVSDADRKQVAEDAAVQLRRHASNITAELQTAWPEVGQRFAALQQEMAPQRASGVPNRYISPKGVASSNFLQSDTESSEYEPSEHESEITLAEAQQSDTETEGSSDYDDQGADGGDQRTIFEEPILDDQPPLPPLINISDYATELASNQLYQIFLNETGATMSVKIQVAADFLDSKSQVPNHPNFRDSEGKVLNADRAKQIIKQRIINNARNPADGAPLVCEMAKSGFADAVGFLLEKGAAPDTYHQKNIKTGVIFKKTKPQARTLLHDAVSSRDPDTVATVLQYNPQANGRIGKKGTTPLHIAAREYAEAMDYNDATRQQNAARIIESLKGAGHLDNWLENPTKKFGIFTVPGKSARQIIDEADLRQANREQAQREAQEQAEAKRLQIAQAREDAARKNADAKRRAGRSGQARLPRPGSSGQSQTPPPANRHLKPVTGSESFGDDPSLQQMNEGSMLYDEVLQQKTPFFNDVAKFIINPSDITESNGRELFASFISGFEKIYRNATNQEHVFNEEAAIGVWTGQVNGQAITLADRCLNPIEKLALIAFVKPKGFDQIVENTAFDDIGAATDLTERLLIADHIVNSICQENDYLEIMDNLLQPDQVVNIVSWAHDKVEGRGGFKEQSEQEHKDKEEIAKRQMILGNPLPSPQRPAWWRSFEALEEAYKRESGRN